MTPALRCLLPLVVIAACSSSATPGADAGDAAAGGSACAKDTRADTFAAGLARRSAEGNLEVRILAAKPAPPNTGDNAWTVALVDPRSGAPVDGATLSVTPFMPDHGHGSAVTPVATSTGAGRFDVTKVYLPMAGLWKITFVAKLGSGDVREAVFNFCLDG